MPDMHVTTLPDTEIARWTEKLLPAQEQKYLTVAGDNGQKILDRVKQIVGQ